MPDPTQELVQADLTDRYRLERELGGGGMSRVFLAHDERLGRRVVVKVLPPTLAAALSTERFRREIMLAAALQHPNIVPVLHAGEAGGQPYFIMPYVDGESLRERLVRGPLSVREMVSVSRDVARALAFAHGRSIVHRDVKPGNILLSAGAAVVTDFGVAKAVTSARSPSGAMIHQGSTGALTSAGTSLGTPTYMAPEQAAADPNVDFRADLYAAGVVMYVMLAGSPPFHGRTPQALLTAQLSEPPPPLASRRYDVPVALDALVMQCLEKDPARRPKSAETLLRRLDDPALLSGAFAAAPAARRQRRWRLAGLVAGGAGVVALAAVLWWAARAPAVPNATAARDSQTLLLPSPTPAPLARSVAVLPLAAVGRDARAGEVAEGLTSELTSAIAGVAGVRVASQTAAVAQQDRRAMPADIARALGVALLLEGTVQRDGDRLRVVLRLVDAAADSTVWSRSFDGATANVLTVQELAANAVVAAFAPRVP
ncbi:MAG: protein kinase [Gemmatirosa sp.]|nr:protein kinase [Gemmatirosa sp.]